MVSYCYIIEACHVLLATAFYCSAWCEHVPIFISYLVTQTYSYLACYGKLKINTEMKIKFTSKSK